MARCLAYSFQHASVPVYLQAIEILGGLLGSAIPEFVSVPCGGATESWHASEPG
jgi:hypothetical protein